MVRGRSEANVTLFEVECLIDYPEGDQERVTEMIEADDEAQALATVDLIYPPIRWGANLVDAWIVGPDSGEV